ncbi:MAG: hypothetical protein SFV21_00080 [Rhodospirillaceae bacterium]|nr:hypothetical protein [Rhodospirillaceae bacterium]
MEPESRRTKMTESPDILIDKIRALPADRVAEVEDFVDFITQRERDRGLVRAATAASATAFARVWNSADDDVYDRI